MKIIGWERKGNVVRFALGKDDLDDWSGDDWNYAPYEYNALSIPLWGTEKYVDISFSYDVSVLEAGDDWHYNGHSPFCMDDFKNRKVPILVIDISGEEKYYSLADDKEGVYGIFMGDKFEDIPWEIIGGVVMTR